MPHEEIPRINGPPEIGKKLALVFVGKRDFGDRFLVIDQHADADNATAQSVQSAFFIAGVERHRLNVENRCGGPPRLTSGAPLVSRLHDCPMGSTS